ncbi:MAG: hypothetical protein M0022_01610 [Desulfobacteraceae bacterium]|nr:hypothetical protein [Desulfobacteraceae bacterium]
MLVLQMYGLFEVDCFIKDGKVQRPFDMVQFGWGAHVEKEMERVRSHILNEVRNFVIYAKDGRRIGTFAVEKVTVCDDYIFVSVK